MSRITNILDQFYQSRKASHIAFWICTVLLLAYYSSLFGGNFQDNCVYMLSQLPIQMAATYLLIYVQFPKFLYKKLWLPFISSFLFLGYGFSVLARLANIYIAEPLTGYEGIDESVWEVISDPIYLLKVYMPVVYMPVVLFLILKMIKDRFQQENQLIALEKEKSSAELNFLKAQMNPHFLFNTLNNIYALAKNKSEHTADMILKLSDLLDYTIYECRAETVPIIKEWQLIENYLDLQAVRNTRQLMISIEQDMDDEARPIAPLILISIVENAFKHALYHKDKISNISISLHLKKGILTFDVFNTKSALSDKISTKKKGIGVANINKQLALLYPNQHQMKVKELSDSYQVTLVINLNE